MSISVACPECSKLLKATPEHLGRRAKCPNCGASVLISPMPDSSLQVPPLPPKTTTPTDESINSIKVESSLPNRKLSKAKFSLPVLVGTACSALLIGYFAGREHVKYEMRSAFSQAGEEIKKGIQNAFGGNAVSSNVEDTEEEVAFEKQLPLSIGKMHAAGEFSVGLIDAEIDNAEVESSLGDSTYNSDDKYLICRFQVRNTDDRKILTFRPSGSFSASDFSLEDDVKNRIRGVSFGYSSDLVGALSSSDDIQPGEHRTHAEVFTIPPPKTEYLILTINLQAFGGEGRIKYKIPSSQIKGFQKE